MECKSVDARIKMSRRSYSSSGLYSGKSAEERKSARRRLLLETGIELIGTKGFAFVSLNMLCAEAGLIKRYFYESFNSVEELLSEAFDQIFSEMQQVLAAQIAQGSNPREMILGGIRSFFEFLRSNPTRGRVFLIESLSVPSTRKSYFDDSRVSELLISSSRQFVQETFPSEAIFRVIAQSTVGATRFVGQKWIESGFEQPIDELVAGVSEVCFGIGDRFGVKLD
jgi:AcrR family transcriptional regulator